MKLKQLQEELDTERIQDLTLDLYKKIKFGDDREADAAQGLLVTALMSNGYTDPSVGELLNSVKSASSMADITKVIARLKINEQDMVEQPEVYKIALTIPFVKKDDVKFAINQLKQKIKNAKIKLLKINVGKTVSTKLEDDEVMNLPVTLKIRTTKDRRRITKVFTPQYRIDNMSYSRNDRV
jgi:hypothetical protein